MNAANSQGLGCFIPCHKCIDNSIHSYSGIQLRLECYEKMKEIKQLKTGEVFITKGYNLPAKYVIHTVGPIIYEEVTDKEREELKKLLYPSFKLYDNKEMVEAWLKRTENLKIPKQLVPRCPVCGGNMEMNLRKDANFVQDKNWYRQAEQYDQFLDEIKDKNVVLLEMGVGFNTPGIIRFPFEQMTYQYLKTILIRMNKDYPMVSQEIQNKTISFDENINQILDVMKTISDNPQNANGKF